MMNIEKHIKTRHTPKEWYTAWISESSIISPAFKIESNPKIGGKFILHSKMGNTTSKMNGKFLVLQPYEKVHYSWLWENSEEYTKVKVKFKAHPYGTLISLNHIGFVNEKSLKSHTIGWEKYINDLEKLIRSKL